MVLNDGLVVDIMRYVSLKGCGMGFNMIVGVRGRVRRGVIDEQWSRHSGVDTVESTQWSHEFIMKLVDYWTINGTQGCMWCLFDGLEYM